MTARNTVAGNHPSEVRLPPTLACLALVVVSFFQARCALSQEWFDDHHLGQTASAFEPPMVTRGQEGEELVWLRTEYLMWWTKGNRIPALVTTSPDGTPRASAGVLPGATVLFGDERIADGDRHGGGVTLGYWFHQGHDTGVEVEWFSIGDDAESDFLMSSTGSPILARPFFNVQTSAEDSQLVAFPSVIDGEVGVFTSSELHSVGVTLRHAVRRGPLGRIDLLAGYRYFRFREGLLIQENLVSTATSGLIAQGTTFDVTDRFDTENDFFGGELGLSAEFFRGPLSLRTQATVGLGNVNQELRVSGSTTVRAPAGSPATTSGGLLALDSNIGLHTNDSFAFLPQLDVDLQYEVHDGFHLSFGYSLLFLTEVLRTGDQIDRRVDSSQIPTASGTTSSTGAPVALMSDTTLWAQGIRLGGIFVY